MLVKGEGFEIKCGMTYNNKINLTVKIYGT